MANKIAAGEVVERPASVVKELVENAIDAGATRIAIAITQGGRKLVSVQDDGCGMTRDDATLSLERQATSKIRDVTDIEEIDTLGFRGEAIPSIASVSRFSITTRRHDDDEGTFIQVNAGAIAEIRTAGCPAGTLVEVRDLFCNVPARRKFLRAYATEEAHVKQIFSVHALAHPSIGFSLTVDGRELYRLAPSDSTADRIRDLFGPEFLENALAVGAKVDRRQATDDKGKSDTISVSGFIERPNLAAPTRRDQYVFINGRPATSASIAYALREAYPRRAGDSRPAAVLFIDLPPNQVDVNVHPTKREVRFRDNVAVKQAILEAVGNALVAPQTPSAKASPTAAATMATSPVIGEERESCGEKPATNDEGRQPTADSRQTGNVSPVVATSPAPQPAPVPIEFAIEPDSTRSKPWQWFRYLAQSASGYLLIETDSGIVTINPHAARERIAYERMLNQADKIPSQTLLIPETVKLSPVDAARIRTSLATIVEMGFLLEEFGHDTFKVDAVPQFAAALSPTGVLTTIASDLAENGNRRGKERWREELIAKSIAKSFAGASMALTEEGATKLVEELCSCRMPYICPRGKPVMIFTSTRELNRKFDRS